MNTQKIRQYDVFSSVGDGNRCLVTTIKGTLSDAVKIVTDCATDDEGYEIIKYGNSQAASIKVGNIHDYIQYIVVPHDTSTV